MSDESSGELVQPTSDEVMTPELGAFVGTMAGSPSLEVGELLAEEVRSFRFKRQLRHLRKAKEQLEAAGMTPNEVPLRTLAPLLEKGSLEDDAGLSDKWSSLLANAAHDATTVPTSFASVLGELEPVEAQILDRLYNALTTLAPPLRRRNGLKLQVGVQEDLGLSDTDLRFHIDNLYRLRLASSLSLLGDDEAEVVGITEYGERFVRSCRPPGTPEVAIQFATQQEVEAHIAANDHAREAVRPLDQIIDGGDAAGT